MPSRWVLGKFLPWLSAEVFNTGYFSALPLLHCLLHELLDHRHPIFVVPCLCGYVFKPLRGDSDALG